MDIFEVVGMVPLLNMIITPPFQSAFFGIVLAIVFSSLQAVFAMRKGREFESKPEDKMG